MIAEMQQLNKSFQIGKSPSGTCSKYVLEFMFVFYKYICRAIVNHTEMKPKKKEKLNDESLLVFG
ncbi:hypothetical protein YWY31_09850 [Paenibacillus illinoisensis]